MAEVFHVQGDPLVTRIEYHVVQRKDSRYGPRQPFYYEVVDVRLVLGNGSSLDAFAVYGDMVWFRHDGKLHNVRPGSEELILKSQMYRKLNPELQ